MGSAGRFSEFRRTACLAFLFHLVGVEVWCSRSERLRFGKRHLVAVREAFGSLEGWAQFMKRDKCAAVLSSDYMSLNTSESGSGLSVDLCGGIKPLLFPVG